MCVFEHFCICTTSANLAVRRLTTGDRALAAFGEGGAGEPRISRLPFVLVLTFFPFLFFNFFSLFCFLTFFPWNLLLMKYLRTRSSSSLATLSVARLFRSLFFLAWQQKLENFLHFSHQVLVELLKVAGDDGDGEGHDQHPADGTHAPNKLDSTQILFHFVIISIEMLVQRSF